MKPNPTPTHPTAPGHTPGPWQTAGLTIYAQPEKRSFGGPVREYLRPVCCMESAELECDEYTTQASGADYNERLPGSHEAEANARLIALAPEMAEALRQLVDAIFDESIPDAEAERRGIMAANKARAILNKIGGAT